MRLQELAVLAADHGDGWPGVGLEGPLCGHLSYCQSRPSGLIQRQRPLRTLTRWPEWGLQIKANGAQDASAMTRPVQSPGGVAQVLCACAPLLEITA